MDPDDHSRVRIDYSIQNNLNRSTDIIPNATNSQWQDFSSAPNNAHGDGSWMSSSQRDHFDSIDAQYSHDHTVYSSHLPDTYSRNHQQSNHLFNSQFLPATKTSQPSLPGQKDLGDALIHKYSSSSIAHNGYLQSISEDLQNYRLLDPIDHSEIDLPILNLPDPCQDLSEPSTEAKATLESFKARIRDLGIQLEPYLVDRLAYDQIRRYKKLIKNKVDHLAACVENSCPSGRFCSDAGGEVEILPSVTVAAVDSDDADSEFNGTISSALFPEGVPLPPSKRLPAKFECPLCFQVKTFQKPSDWTKHVLEDVQPYTCTFDQCSDPKTFKRKADWIRHENERHRHLEWWECNIEDCRHKCYRKDNFVQHLVREHRLKEPKFKTGRAAKDRTLSRADQDFWQIVDDCRHSNDPGPTSEPCRFCGNVCDSWKKLSVHIAKHFEQIALPVLDLVAERFIASDIVVSPIEPTSYHLYLQQIPDNFTHPAFRNSDNSGVLYNPFSPYSTDQFAPLSQNVGTYVVDQPFVSEDITRQTTSRDSQSQFPVPISTQSFLPTIVQSFERQSSNEVRLPPPASAYNSIASKPPRQQTSGESTHNQPWTDSGYASRRNHGDVGGTAKSSVSDHLGELETNTVYSSGQSVDTTRRDDFIERLAELVLEDVQQHGPITFETFNGIGEVLADFAMRLAYNNSDSPHKLRRITVFIHKHRYSLISLLQQMAYEASDDDTDPGRDRQGKMPIEELMQMWADHEQEIDADVFNGEENEIAESPVEEGDDPFQNDMEAYERIITATSAYRWLVNSLRNRALLTPIGDDIGIRGQISQNIPRTARLSRSQPAMPNLATFHIDWDQQGAEDSVRSLNLGAVMTITGSAQEAQAMTCAQYMQQTWPSNGAFILQLIEDALQSPGTRISRDRDDGTGFSILLQGTRLTITANGIRSVIIEVGEQLCWMYAAIQAAPLEFDGGLVICSPVVELRQDPRLKESHTLSSASGGSSQALPRFQDFSARAVSGSYFVQRFDRPVFKGTRSSPAYRTQNEPPMTSAHVKGNTEEQDMNKKREKPIFHFEIVLKYEKYDRSALPGTCWHSMFKRCIVVKDFPIRRRPNAELGLELNLEVIAELIGSKYLHQFGEHLFFKQFSVMLAPTSYDSEALLWHVCKTKDGERISYLDHGVSNLPKVSFDDLLKVRHIIGWCSNIEHLCGHIDGDYDVESSMLPASPESGVLFNCQLSFGRPVNGSNDVHFSVNHQRASFSQRNYLDMFRFLERRSILFWDTDACRGWLTNGLRALLHLLRQSLHIDESEDVGNLFVLKAEDLAEPEKPGSARAAREFLSNTKNLAAKVSISIIRGTNREYEVLSERFERMYDVLEKAFDYQSRCRSWDRIPRSYLEGWDFLSLARRDDPLYSSMFSLPSVGRSWVDFTRSLGTVTLIGSGFGEMLKPAMSFCGSVPRDRFYVAVSATDLRDMIGRNRCKVAAKSTLLCRSPSILWYSPAGSLDACGCHDTPGKGGIPSRVQVMLPGAHTVTQLPEADPLDLNQYSNGAFIFGQHDGLPCYPGDFELEPIPGSPPDPTKELEVADSGIGSSIESTTGSLEKVPTTSSLFSSDHLKPVSTNSSRRSQNYGNSFLSGGYGIYGNIEGNLSVTQYFGSADGCHPPSHTLAPKSETDRVDESRKRKRTHST